jgi:hypothetical protein
MPLYRVNLRYRRNNEEYLMEKDIESKELLEDTLIEVAKSAKQFILLAKASSQVSFANFNGAVIVLRDTSQYSAIVTYGKEVRSKSSDASNWTSLDQSELDIVLKYLSENIHGVYGLPDIEGKDG